MKFESFSIFVHKIIIFLVQQITTKTDLRCFKKPAPEKQRKVKKKI